MRYTILMNKKKKKRTKKYTGVDAVATRPAVHRITAINRSTTGQWLHERRSYLRRIGTALLIAGLLGLIISGILSLF